MAKSINKKFFDFDLLKRVLRFAAPYKKRFYWSIALAIILAVFTPVRPILIQITVDKYISGGLWKWVLVITIIQIGFLFLETGLRFYFSYITAWLGQNVVKDLRVKVYKKILSLNLSQFDKTPIGTLTTRTVDDIERINDVAREGVTILQVVPGLLRAGWYFRGIASSTRATKDSRMWKINLCRWHARVRNLFALSEEMKLFVLQTITLLICLLLS